MKIATSVSSVREREAAELAAVAAATRVDEARAAFWNALATLVQDLSPLVKDALRARKAR